MPPTESYPTTASFVSSHIHVDGPIPGPHSLLTVTSVAHTADGDPIGTFTANVRELPGASLHPAALQEWKRKAEDWLCTRRGSRPPAQVMTAYAGWISDLPGEKVFVSDPDEPDYLFLCWYLQRFAGLWPYSRTSAAAPAGALDPTGLCSLGGCRQGLITSPRRTPVLAGAG